MMSKANKTTDSKMGRPTVVTDEVVSILVSSFQNGLNITQACLQAGITRETFYSYGKKHKDFADKMNLAQEYASMKARANLINAINNGDKDISKWLLERKNRDEFATKQETDNNLAGEIVVKWQDQND